MWLSVNGLYTVLDEIGTWNASWTEVCDSIHALADQASCLNYTLTAANAGCSVTGAGIEHSRFIMTMMTK